MKITPPVLVSVGKLQRLALDHDGTIESYDGYAWLTINGHTFYAVLPAEVTA